MLSRLAQQRRRTLTLADQLAAFWRFVEPPGQDHRSIGAPQGQASLTQLLIGAGRIELDQQRVAFITVLADDLLRILAQAFQASALQRLGITGQAQHQGLQGLLHGRVAAFRLLIRHRFTHLIKTGNRRGQCWQAQERQTEEQQADGQTHWRGLSQGMAVRRAGHKGLYLKQPLKPRQPEPAPATKRMHASGRYRASLIKSRAFASRYARQVP